MADHKHELHGGSSLAERDEHGLAEGLDRKYESSEVELRPIASTTYIIILTVVISQIVVYIAWRAWTSSYHANQPVLSPIFQLQQEAPGPRLQVSEPTDLKAWKKDMATPLSGYAMNEDGTARIPVADAIKMIGEKGALPTGADWSLKPGEKMVGGVIMTPEQVTYANQPPSSAPAEQPAAAAPPATTNTPAKAATAGSATKGQ